MLKKRERFNNFFVLFFKVASLILCLLFYFVIFLETTQAEDNLSLKVFRQSNLKQALQEINDLDFKQGANLVIGDINLDGREEIVLGLKNRVVFFNYKGGKVYPDLVPFAQEYAGLVDVALGDIGGDGFLELIVAQNTTGEGLIKVFSIAQQKLLVEFPAFEDIKRGVYLAVCDLEGDGKAEIVVATGMSARSHIRIFRGDGTYTKVEYFPYTPGFKGGVDLACGDIDGDGKPEVVSGANRQGTSHIRYLKIGQSEPLNSFYTFDQKFLGGVNISVADLDKDGRVELLAGAGPGAEPNVKVFKDWKYNLRLINFYPYPKTYAYGVNIGAGDVDGDGVLEIISVPAVHIGGPKRIEIDLSEQKLRIMEGDLVLGEYLVSTGKRSMPTPVGTFKVLNKIPRAYSRTYGLYMPYWMGFTYQGHGMHELPEWPNGYKEGANHLGIPVSHGCVRLGVGPAKRVYDWAEVGTSVIVKK